MNPEGRAHELTACDVLRRYAEDGVGEFCDVNQHGSDGDTPLHVACYRGSFEEAKALVDAGADVNAPGDMSCTPLHAAAKSGLFCGHPTASQEVDSRIVELLLAHGAAPDAIDEFGETPLGAAKRTRKDEMAKVLQERMENN
jgi:uncharacterized protein